MQESKEISWATDGDNEAVEDLPDVEQAANDSDVTDPDGWQQYRKWISKAPAPRRRRTGVDPSLYTWKGYRNWSEQIKRDWSDD